MARINTRNHGIALGRLAADPRCPARSCPGCTPGPRLRRHAVAVRRDR